MAQQIIIDGLKRQYDDRLVLPIPRLKTNNPEQLEKVLRQQIKTVGDRPLLWSTLGQSLMKHGEWQEATFAFRAALKQRPDAYDYAGSPMRWTGCISRKKRPPCAATVLC
ncbi:putative protoheme IX biogenesis protein [Citrobacter koseri]|nr:putative protoheme IX biogenesis protein [Citrobacter koseri]